MYRKSITIGLFLFLAHYSLLAQDADDVIGIWNTADQRGKVEIYPCDNDYCGKIVWMIEPNGPDGNPRKDIENPEPDLRNRTIQNLQILKDLEYDGDGEYEDGEIYDPESGKTYSCLMRLSEDGNSLEIRGYIGFSLIGRSEEWTRTETIE